MVAIGIRNPYAEMKVGEAWGEIRLKTVWPIYSTVSVRLDELTIVVDTVSGRPLLFNTLRSWVLAPLSHEHLTPCDHEYSTPWRHDLLRLKVYNVRSGIQHELEVLSLWNRGFERDNRTGFSTSVFFIWIEPIWYPLIHNLKMLWIRLWIHQRIQ